MSKCTCNWVTKTLGDGCSVCNSQMMIDMLLEENRELEQRIAEAESQLYDAINIGVKQSFDLVKMVQANTDDEHKANILDDIADLIIEEASEYKVKWKSIAELEQPKTCEGCEYEGNVSRLTCMHCSRDGEDLYMPKKDN